MWSTLPWLEKMPHTAVHQKRLKCLMTSKVWNSSFNSLWSSDIRWQHRSGSSLAQIIACCLTAPSHYLNQCWLIINEVLCHSPKGSITRVHSRQGNVREKWNFSRSGNCQGILQSVREILTFAKLMKNVMEFHIMSGKMTHFRQHDSPDSTYIDQTAKSRLGNFLK